LLTPLPSGFFGRYATAGLSLFFLFSKCTGTKLEGKNSRAKHFIVQQYSGDGIAKQVPKAIKLTKLATTYDCIVFHYDVRLLMIFWLLYCVRYLSKPNDRIVFTTFLNDVSSFTRFPLLSKGWIREKLRFIYYFIFTRMAKVIVVHSSAEIDIYAKAFQLPRDRFEFIPYFVRRDALNSNQQNISLPIAQYILAAGRQRDFQTFISAMRDAPFQGVIVAG